MPTNDPITRNHAKVLEQRKKEAAKPPRREKTKPTDKEPGDKTDA